MSITVGLTGSAETVVTDQNTAAALGSGSLPVFATPAMVALMETAAVAALEGHLDLGESSVGTQLEISHDAASPVGISVRAEAEVVAVTGKAISFTVRCYDSFGVIGSGTHQRYIIAVDRFLAKAAQRNQ
ncbi:MAG: thioesterase family protein [Oscillospiraceae bacterium]